MSPLRRFLICLLSGHFWGGWVRLSRYPSGRAGEWCIRCNRAKPRPPGWLESNDSEPPTR